jgi:pullulanase
MSWAIKSFKEERKRLDEEMKANKLNQYKMPEVGQFNDFFRDIVKGKTSSEEVNVKGYITGDTSMIEAMKACMVGNSIDKGTNRHFLTNTQSINYVECHDNHTVWDKMMESNREESNEVKIKRQKMMIGVTLLSIGIPFIHSGQEFARTKNGVSNSYRSPDNINRIDWLRKERYMEIFEYTKDMISLRKQLPIFHNDNQELVEAHVDFRNFDGMLITHYQCPILQPFNEIWIYINPSNQIYSEHFDKTVKVIADENGLVDGKEIDKVTINPYTLTVFAR